MNEKNTETLNELTNAVGEMPETDVYEKEGVLTLDVHLPNNLLLDRLDEYLKFGLHQHTYSADWLEEEELVRFEVY